MESLRLLGMRAVACPAWRWQEGMLAEGKPYNLGGVGKHRVVGVSSFNTKEMPVAENGGEIHGAIPDLADMATLGCLLGLVRTLKDEDRLYVRPEKSGKWRVMVCDFSIFWEGETEAAALIEALTFASGQVE
jgi:hypothetical protein